MELKAHRGASEKATTMKPVIITHEDMMTMLENPKDTKSTDTLFFGRLYGNQRRKANVISKSALMLDADNSDPMLGMVLDVLLHDFRYYYHTTFSSTADSPRHRIIIPLGEDATGEEYSFMVDVLLQYISDGINPRMFDKTCREPSRLFYAPAAQDKSEYDYGLNDGKLFTLSDAEGINLFLPETVELEAPKVKESDYPDADTIEGVVGDFNRAYGNDLDAVIRDFKLPYEPTDEAGLWKYTPAKSEPGMKAMDGGYFYSHHASDPANGARLTVFDVVVAHRFDGSVTEAKKVLGNCKRVKEMYREETKAVALQAFEPIETPVLEGELVEEGDAPSGDNSAPFDPAFIIDKFREFDKRKMMFEPTVYNLDVLAAYDPTVRSITKNELLNDVIFSEPTPWGTGAGEPLESADLSSLLMHLQRTYNIGIAKHRLEDFTNELAQKKRFNPVKDYLDSLEWDGVERLGAALPGVVEDDYTAMVARKCLTAAVARVYEPGIKWDHILVIQGTQGLGKTYWIEKMSRGFASQLGNISNPETVKTLHQSWISVSDEGASFSKGGFAEWKDFITRTGDDFRLPYDKRSHHRKRAQVIWATTNDEDFIPEDEQGTRRFLVVKATEKVDFDSLTDEYIDQVWAEAKALYQAGEKLYLSDEEMEQAEAVRETFTGHDGWRGQIEAFISSPVAEDWDSLSLDQKEVWKNSHANGFVTSTHRRTEVSAAQVWTELFGKTLADARNGEVKRIDRILKSMSCLRMVGTNVHQPGYGTQVVYKVIEYPAPAENFSKKGVSSNYFGEII